MSKGNRIKEKIGGDAKARGCLQDYLVSPVWAEDNTLTAVQALRYQYLHTVQSVVSAQPTPCASKCLA